MTERYLHRYWMEKSSLHGGICESVHVGDQQADIQISDKMNDSLHDFVFISESSARANLIRIALGRNTLNPANP